MVARRSQSRTDRGSPIRVTPVCAADQRVRMMVPRLPGRGPGSRRDQVSLFAGLIRHEAAQFPRQNGNHACGLFAPCDGGFRDCPKHSRARHVSCRDLLDLALAPRWFLWRRSAVTDGPAEINPHRFTSFQAFGARGAGLVASASSSNSRAEYP